MTTEKTLLVNRSNGNKVATDNELMKFGLVCLARCAFLDEDGDFAVLAGGRAFKVREFNIPENRREAASEHLEKHVEAVETKWEKSSDIVCAVVKTSFEIVE